MEIDIQLALFYSYAREDKLLRERLDKHLTILKYLGFITTWHTQEIVAGKEWAVENSKHLEEADIILLLISADFLATGYCFDTEMTNAMKRHEAGSASVIPILLRPVDWKSAPFDKLQVLPSNGKAVSIWRQRDEAFVDIAQGIRRVVEDKRLRLLPSASAPQGSKVDIGSQKDTCYLYSEALNKYVRRLFGEPNNVFLHFLIGNTLTDLKLHNAQYSYSFLPLIDHYGEAVSEDDQLGWITQLDQLLKDTNASDPLSAIALAAYSKALRLNPHLIEGYYGKGRLLWLLNSFDEVLDVYKQAIYLRPTSPQAYYSFSLVLNKVGHHEEAATTYQQAIDLDPYVVNTYLDWEYAFTPLSNI